MPNEEARVEIFEKLTKGMRLRKDFPFQELVTWTPGYVGADLQTLCKEASIIAVERVIRSTENKVEVKEGGEAQPNGAIEEEKKEADPKSSDDADNDVDLTQFYIEVEDF